MPVAQINLPDDGGDEFELVAQFAGHPHGGTIHPSSGELTFKTRVPISEREKAMPTLDRGGATLFYVVFARKAVDHYGTSEVVDLYGPEPTDRADRLANWTADALDDARGFRTYEQLMEGT